MRVGILGPLEIRTGTGRVMLRGARLRTLLIRLALDAERPVSTDTLSEALWPGAHPPADARHALHSLVSRLRRALTDGDSLRSVPGGYRLDLPADAVDVHRFERLARDGRAALHDGCADVASARLREALALWRGPALVDVADAPFAAATVMYLDELRLAAIEDRAQADLQIGAGLASVVADLQTVTIAHPERQRARALLLRALHADGRSAEALRSYEEFRSSLAERFGADPAAELREAHIAVLRDEPQSPPRRRRGNLPVPLTTFVARPEEQALVRARLAAARLVTLVGPGGAGKTRLATTVAADLEADLTGGAWLVELASVTDPRDVPRAVLDACGSGTAGIADTRAGTVDRLAGALSAAPALLVLDNCEHLLDAVAALGAELLARCAGLRVLATSREPLGVTGEALVAVPPLPLPPPTATVAEIRSCPAVRLLTERAVAVHPGFAVTAGNAAAVAELCRRLDGLPLAIELAAARARSFPVEQLLALLDDRFRLLSGGSRAALPRHRTLRAVVDWSWDLLDEHERLLVESLSVFTGTIAPEAAEHVHPPAGPGWETLAAAADKSLLHPVDGHRYRMLETIRAYGFERLAARDALDAARAAHARYFLALADSALPHLHGPEQLRWLPLLADERDNLLGALQFVCDSGDGDAAVRLATALSSSLMLRGDHTEAARLLRLALDVDQDPATEVRAPAVAGYLVNVALSGSTPPTGPETERLRASARCAHPTAALIEPLLAVLSGGSAGIDRAPHPDPFVAAMSWLVRSLENGNRGDLRAACRDLAAAADGFQAIGERWGLVTSLTHLGVLRTMLGDLRGAIGALERSLVPARELGADDHQRVWLATARAYTDDPEGARSDLRGVLAGDPVAHHLAMARMTLGDLARRRGDLPAAAREYDLAAQATGPRGPAPLRAIHHLGSGRLALAGGEIDAAARQLGEALKAAIGTSDMVLVAAIGAGLADLLVTRGEHVTAAQLLGAAHALRGAADAHNPDIARVTGELREVLGDQATAAHYDRGRRHGRTAALALLERAASGPRR